MSLRLQAKPAMLPEGYGGGTLPVRPFRPDPRGESRPGALWPNAEGCQTLVSWQMSKEGPDWVGHTLAISRWPLACTGSASPLLLREESRVPPSAVQPVGATGPSRVGPGSPTVQQWDCSEALRS